MWRRSLIHHQFWGCNTIQFPLCSSTLPYFIMVLFLLISVGLFNVCECKEAHLFMFQVLNVLNYLQCPAWVSTRGPALSSASITLVAHRLKPKELSSTMAQLPPALLPLSWGLPIICWGGAGQERYAWTNMVAKGSCFPALKLPCFQQVFQAILNVSTQSERMGGGQGAW